MNREDRLYKGIFWITDIDDPIMGNLYFTIPVEPDGTIDPSVDRMSLNSQNNDNYNHKKVWENLGSKATNNKSFDYYPRGRVEISNRKAVIYASPYICTEEVVDWIKDTFHLTDQNGINNIRVVPDNSYHYKCYLDR